MEIKQVEKLITTLKGHPSRRHLREESKICFVEKEVIQMYHHCDIQEEGSL